jgi:uncharacterized protein YbjQ (UPF0145 family)
VRAEARQVKRPACVGIVGPQEVDAFVKDVGAPWTREALFEGSCLRATAGDPGRGGAGPREGGAGRTLACRSNLGKCGRVALRLAVVTVVLDSVRFRQELPSAVCSPSVREMNDTTSDHPYRTGIERTRKVIVTTSNDISDYLGVVRGLTVRSTSFGKAVMGGFRSLAGGNIKEYVEVCEGARHDAFAQLEEHAELLNADAVIGMRYDATEFGQGTTEVLAYGTAVRLSKRG